MRVINVRITTFKVAAIALLTAIAPQLYAQEGDTLKLDSGTTITSTDNMPTALQQAAHSEVNYQLPKSKLTLPISMLIQRDEELNFNENRAYRINTAELIEKIGVGENNFIAPSPLTPTLHGTDFNNYGVLFELPRGAITGYGSQRTMVALGAINRAGVGYTHNFNPQLSVGAYAGVSQFSSPFARQNSFDFSGSVRYQINDRVGLRAFGSYSTGQLMPTLSTANYGATVSYKFSDVFTMEVGAQNVYDSYSGRWQVIPVAIPHLTIGEITIGMDVGGLLYDIIRSAMSPNWNGMPMQGVGGAPPPTQRPPRR